MTTILTGRTLSPELRAAIETAAPGVRLLVSRDRAEYRRLLPRADVIYGGRIRFEEVPLAARLRWAHADYAGVEEWPLEELRCHGIVLTNSRGLGDDTVADHVMMLILALARRLPACLRYQDARTWGPDVPVLPLAGRRLAVVGFGHVGRAVARRALACGMNVTALRRGAPGAGGAREQGVTIQGSGVEVRPDIRPYVNLFGVLPDADVLVLACPLTAETRGLISADALALMKESALLINVSRGEVVDEDALANALRQGLLGGAGLDVFSEEPLPPESPWWDLPNVIVTPHAAGNLPDYQAAAVPLFVSNLQRFIGGRALENEVDLVRGY